MNPEAPSHAVYRFDRFALDLARGALLAPDGSEVPLRPKSFSLLQLLVENAGCLLDRDAIMQAVWPGVFVTDDSIAQCVRDVRRALGDETQRLLRTVRRRGYLLVAEVVPGQPATAPRDRPARPRHRGLTARALPSLPNQPSIAVLPFQNLSGDPEQEYFADGIVDDITTELARFRWLFVIARNSSFTYKGRAVDVRQVGRELGVRYVLEGSVRRGGERMRITGQLIDASTGAHLWADRFDGEAADIFELQDQVTARVVATIAPCLEQAELERTRRKPADGLDAYDYYLRGLAAFSLFTAADNRQALALFKTTIELAPDHAAACGMAARCYLQRKAFGWATLTPSDVADAERLARRAADQGREDAVASGAAAGALLTVVGDVDAGTALVDRSLALNANLAWVWNYSAYARLFLGEPEIAIEHATRAMRLSPYDPQMFGIQAAVAFAHLFAGRYEEASSWADAAARQQPGFLVGTCVSAASAALAGKVDEAVRAVDRLRRLHPALRLGNLDRLLPFRRPQDAARWAEGLRRAGLPD